MSGGTNDDLFRAALQHHQAGRAGAAEGLYYQILTRNAEHAGALHYLGMLAHEHGRHEEGIALIRRSIEVTPAESAAEATFRGNLGAVLGRLGRHAEAVTHLREAARLRPGLAVAQKNVGAALASLEHFPEAAAAFAEATRLDPWAPDAYAALGRALFEIGRVDDAVAALDRALALDPRREDALHFLALARQEQGRTAEAVDCYRRLVDLIPESPSLHGELLYVLHYDARADPHAIFSEHLAWASRHARPLYPRELAYPNPPDPGRRLRVGYVSSDFRRHPVARFLEPALTHRDSGRFEIYCYSDVTRPDAVTARLRSAVDHWRSTVGMSDEQVDRLVRADAIDLLVDLNGHTAGNRLLVFARKPAPVQATFNGYVDTTGLATMDYRVTDAHHDPVGRTEHLHTEHLVRLPECNWCYRADDEAPEVGPAPARGAGYVTFGCLNKLTKVTPQVLRVWARVLADTAGSRLLVSLFGGEDMNRSVRAAFEAAGVPGERLTLLRKGGTHRQYLERFGRIDVCLDTFPFNGITTTCDALWAGVPVVTLAGRTHVSRAGASLLSAVGLAELIADSPDAYVARASALARDIEGLAALRAGLRERVRRSALGDAPGYTARLEQAYQWMWARWCGAAQPTPSDG